MKLFILFIPSFLFAQCNLINQSGCNTVCNIPACASANPSLGTFLANEETSFTAIYASIANLPQNKIIMNPQILPLAAPYYPTAPSKFGPSALNYVKQLVLLKHTNFDLFVPAAVMASSPGYSPSGGNYVVVSDCPGNATFAYGSTPPAGTNYTHNPNCMGLYDIDQVMSYLSTNGYTVGGGMAGIDTATVSACTRIWNARTW